MIYDRTYFYHQNIKNNVLSIFHANIKNNNKYSKN